MGPVERSIAKNPPHPSADAGQGNAVENADKDPVAGHPDCFGQNRGRIVHKLETGDQGDHIEIVVLEWKINRVPAKQFRPAAQSLSRPVEHDRRRFQPGDIQAFPPEHLNVNARSTSHVQQPFPRTRTEQPQNQVTLQAYGRPSRLGSVPGVLTHGGFTVENIAHAAPCAGDRHTIPGIAPGRPGSARGGSPAAAVIRSLTVIFKPENDR